MNQENFKLALAEAGIYLTDNQLEQFSNYFQLLVEWNQKMNLTAITDEEGIYLKHFYDSVMVLWQWPISEGSHLVDVGAGAGFPSIPLKILRPDLQVTIVDSLNKRISFLNHLVERLKLEGVTCVHGRAEDVGQNLQYRGQFDLATARAVAPLNVLAEYCLPLVKKGGYFLALKAAKSDMEIDEAQAAFKVLGAKFIGSKTDILPVEESERTFIKIQKTLDTPKQYPRKAGKPSKDPIK